MTDRKIVCDDAVRWLNAQPDGSLDNVVTGICDLNETDMTLDQYLDFFYKVAGFIMKKVSPQGYAIFVQTDRRYQGRWIDKSYILTETAVNAGLLLKWHKIVLLRSVGATDLHRPTYSHFLCYSRSGKPGISTPDVLDFGKRIYKNATSMKAAEQAIMFIKKNNPGTVVDPFVGRGTIVALANKHGLSAVGIDIDPEQCEEARRLRL